MDGVVVRATVAYDGTHFAGFQLQPGSRSVQGVLESALESLYGQRVRVYGAGRTDSGVHARGQVVAWYGPRRIPPERVAVAVNSRLPDDVALRDSAEAVPGFDPRRHAVRRVYRYTFVYDLLREPRRDRYVTRLVAPVDLDAMREASAALVGLHEFRSLSTVGDEEELTRRTLDAVTWEDSGPLVTVQWEARSFLRKQVRCMMGALFAVGRGKFGPEVIAELLAGRPWPPQMVVAPPNGLVLERVDYERKQ